MSTCPSVYMFWAMGWMLTMSFHACWPFMSVCVYVCCCHSDAYHLPGSLRNDTSTDLCLWWCKILIHCLFFSHLCCFLQVSRITQSFSSKPFYMEQSCPEELKLRPALAFICETHTGQFLEDYLVFFTHSYEVKSTRGCQDFKSGVRIS